MSDKTVAFLRSKSFSRPVPVPDAQSVDRYRRQLRRLGADDALIARLTGPRRRPSVPWYRPLARWRR